MHEHYGLRRPPGCYKYTWRLGEAYYHFLEQPGIAVSKPWLRKQLRKRGRHFFGVRNSDENLRLMKPTGRQRYYWEQREWVPGDKDPQPGEARVLLLRTKDLEMIALKVQFHCPLCKLPIENDRLRDRIGSGRYRPRANVEICGHCAEELFLAQMETYSMWEIVRGGYVKEHRFWQPKNPRYPIPGLEPVLEQLRRHVRHYERYGVSMKMEKRRALRKLLIPAVEGVYVVVAAMQEERGATSLQTSLVDFFQREFQ